MLVLGIDPGSVVTGYGIIKVEGSKLQYVTSGCIKPKKSVFTERLTEIAAGIHQLLDQHASLDQVAIEQVFLNRNVDSALKLGHARGAIIVSVATRLLPIAEYSARSIKQAIVGRGGADKSQVQYMVRMLLGLKGDLAADASDALAVALCHIHTEQGSQRLRRQLA